MILFDIARRIQYNKKLLQKQKGKTPDEIQILAKVKKAWKKLSQQKQNKRLNPTFEKAKE